MRKLVFFCLAICWAAAAFAQTIVYHETFEQPSGADSVTSSGASAWSINTRIAAEGVQCDSNYVVAGDSSFLITAPFNCTGFPNVVLQFSHICKIELLDAGEIFVSANFGPWIKLTATEYINPGNSQFASQGNKFSSNTYPIDWQSSQNLLKPTNTWWKNETFDISALVANQTNVRIKFRLKDGTNNGSAGAHGWYIDNIRVSGALSELTPPVITYKPPVLQDTVFSTGPFNIYTWITDDSGIDTAYIAYTANGGPTQYVPMTWVSDTTWLGVIPSYTWFTNISYYAYAEDSSLSHNATTASTKNFYNKPGPTTVTIGTGTNSISYPYNTTWHDAKTQMLYTASELIAGGGAAGQITRIAFNVASVGSPIMQNFNIRMQNYSGSTLSAFVSSGWTTVYTGSYSPAATGWQEIILQTPFGWNGTSSLLIEICFDNTSWSGASSVYGTTATALCYHENADGSAGCGFSNGSAQTSRPNIRLTFPANNNMFDAGIAQITSPTGTILGSGPHPVTVTMKNYSIDTLTSVKIKYSVDGTLRDSLNWTGTLFAGVTSLPFDIDTTTFGIGQHTLKVWTELPNGSGDQNNLNDTATVIFFLCDSLLSGTYTVGGGGNFANFASVIGTLNNCGIGGPVTFLINTGTYNEQLTFIPVTGSSAVNTITFKPNTGATVTLTNNSASGTLKFSGADNIIFDGSNNGTTSRDMSIINTSTSANNTAIWLASAGTGAGCTGITIKNCNITAGSNTVTSYGIHAGGTTIGSAGADNDNLTINNNLIRKAYYGIWVNGVATTGIVNNLSIDNNTLGSTIASEYITYMGVYLMQSDQASIRKNTIRNIISGNTGNTAINIGTGVTNATVYANNITGIRYTGTAGNAAKGIEVSTNNTSSNILIANNMISDILGDGGTTYATTVRGIGIDAGSGVIMVAHNSVYLSGDASNGGSTSAGLFGALTVNAAASGLNIRNNIFQNSITKTSAPTARAYAVYSYAANTVYNAINYNDYYVTGTQGVLGYLGSARTTLTDWQTATAQDANSRNADPIFTSTTNLHTFAVSVNNLGTPIALVPDDIDGDVRSATTPDLGADEFTPLSDDIGIISILSPGNGCGYTNNETVSIRVRNYGTDPITSADMYYSVNGGAAVQEVFNGSIAPDSSYTYIFTTGADLSVPGNYTIKAWVDLTDDVNLLNDTTNRSIYSGYNFSYGPYTMGFESTENFSDWTVLNVNGDGETWNLPWTGTPHSGTRSARYYNSTSAAGNEWLFSRCFTFEAGNTYEIEYWYRVDNATYPQSIDLKIGTSPTPAAMTTTLVSMPNMNNAIYQKATASFTAPSSGAYYFAWHAYSAASNYYYAYIDDININLIPNQEATAYAIIQPEGACGMSNTETVSLQIINSGAQAINGNLTACYSANGAPAVCEAVAASIPVGDTLDYIFSGTLDMFAPVADSMFNITAWVSLTGDPLLYNDTAFVQVLSQYAPPAPTVISDTVPYGGIAVLSAVSPSLIKWWDSPSGGLLLGTGNTYTTPSLYATTVYYVEAQNGTGNQTWTFDGNLQGWTATLACGSPVTWVWNSDGGSGTAFAVNHGTNSSQVLTSPLVPVSGATSINLSYRHRFGTESCCDHGFVAYRLDGGPWVQFIPTTGAYSGNDDQYNEPFWSGCTNSASMPLYFGTAPYATHSGPINVSGAAEIEIAFVFTTDGSGLVDGWYIDEVSLSGLAACTSPRVPDTAYVMLLPWEAGIIDLISPEDGCAGNSEEVTIRIRNNGDSTITVMNAYYQAGLAPVVSELINTSLLPGDTLVYTFTTTLDPGTSPSNPDTNIFLTTWIELSGDTYALNDSSAHNYEFLYVPPAPIVTNVVIPYGSSTTLTAVSPDPMKWYSVPSGGSPIGYGSYTTPVLYDTTVYWVEASTSDPGFTITGLLATGSYVVDHDGITGDDRGGIVVTEQYLYYNGDGSGIRYNMPGLTNGIAVSRQDGICADLSGAGTTYTLWNGTAAPVGISLSSAYTVTSLRSLNPDNTLGSTIIPLSQNIVMGSGSGCGIFSGAGFIILYNNTTGTPANTWYRIDLPSGQVSVLGAWALTAATAENWARWGIADYTNNTYGAIYVNNSTQINRMNLTNGTVSAVGTFTNLSDMASITYAPWYNRWYFHHEYSSQFGGTNETIGYANAVGEMNSGCPSERVADTVFISGTPPCDMEVTAIYSPVSGVELTTSETVVATVRNNGSDTATNVPISFTIDGGTPVNEIIAGPIAPSDTLMYTFTATADLSALATFVIEVYTGLVCDTLNNNDTMSISVTNSPLVYCTSIPTNTADEEIFSVTFNGVTNAYSCTTVAPGPGSVLNCYSNFTTLPPLTAFIRGSVVPFTIQVDECDGATYYSNGCAIWVDFNRNGSFTDAGEQVYVENTTTSSPRTINGSFTVPLGSFQGETRMRIIVAEGYSGSALQPCMSYGYGETEDYNVTIMNQIPHDAGVISINQPAATEAEGASVAVDVVVRNYGQDLITNASNMTVAYSHNGGPVQSIIWAGGDIASLATAAVLLPNLTVTAGNNTLCAWTVLAGDSNTFNDTLCMTFYGTPNLDAGVTQFIQPAALTGNEGATQTVQVQITNFGTDTLTSIPVSYTINGAVQATQTWTGTLLPGGNSSLTFTQTYLIPGGTYELCAYTGMVPDGDHNNDTLCISPYGLFTETLPYYTDFDGPATWTQTDAGNGSLWQLGTPAFGTTNSAHSAPNAWDINLSSNYTPYAAAYLYSPNFDFTGIVNAKLSCWINVGVENCCDGLTLQYSTDGSMTWQNLGIVADPNGVNWYTATTGGSPSWITTSGWIKTEYTLTPVNNQPSVRFRYFFHSDVSGQVSGASVDDFSITIPSPIDAGVEMIKTPTVQAPAGSLRTVKALVRNYGMDTLTSIPLAYTVNGGLPVQATWNGQLLPNDTITYTFATQFSVPGGMFDLCAYTEVPGDGDYLNDTSCNTLTGVMTFVVPWSDDLEGTVYWFDDGGNASWEWGVPTATTINNAHSPTHCWATNLDGDYMNSSNDFLYTPYFLFTQVNDATLDFWHWYHTETGVDGGKIEYSLNSGSTWITLGYVGDPQATNWYTHTISGTPYFSGSSGGWVHSTYNLSSIPAIVNATVPVQFRYRFMSSASNSAFNGWAVDDFAITAPPIPKDAGVIAIMTPSGSTVTGSSVTVQVTIQNFGTDTLQTVPVAYSVNGGAYVLQTWSGNLASGATTNFTFTTPFTSPAADYELCAFTKKSGDIYLFNDTTCLSVTATAAPLDAGVTLILAPGLTTNAGDSTEVQIRVRNFGTNTLTSIPLGYSRNGVQIATATWTGNLVSGDSVDYTFTQKYISPASNYSLCAYSMLGGDANAANDQTCIYPQGVIGMEEYDGSGFWLWQNIPNPAHGSCRIDFNVPSSAQVTFELTNVLGQVISRRSIHAVAGKNSLELNVGTLAVGVYSYAVVYEGQRLSRKMVVTK